MDITKYNQQQEQPYNEICKVLQKEIDLGLTEAKSKLWHGGPVWFLEGNPIVGYSVRKTKAGSWVQLMFWSGIDFNEKKLFQVGKYPTGAIKYSTIDDVNRVDLSRWLIKSKKIQWDYKNIVKRRGKLEKLTDF